MANTKLFLDTRRTKPGNPAPVFIAIRNKRTSAYISAGIKVLPEHWNAELGCVVLHPLRKSINARLNFLKSEVDAALLSIANSSPVREMSASELKKKVNAITNGQECESPKGLFLEHFKKFVDLKHGRTAVIYRATLSRIRAFKPDSCDSLCFEDINNAWLNEFDAFLALTELSANSRSIHLRNIRAVFNNAIDDDITTHYPFRRFKIKSEATRKRSFDVQTLRRILTYTCEKEWQQKYLDFFKITFMLIGINVIDLCRLKSISAGRIDYIRAKTHKQYSIKVEPEAEEIIKRYLGTKGLLLNFAERNANYRQFYNNLVKGLKAVRKQLGLSELTTYWARHSWATMAASLDIPKETIAAALGHGGNTVTDIYISFDQRKIDEANRRVLDWVLYGKR